MRGRRIVTAGGLAAATVGLTPGVAHAASIDTGVMYFRQYDIAGADPVIYGCGRALLTTYGTSVVSQSNTFARSSTSCATNVGLTAGRLVAQSWVFVNGGICTSAAASNPSGGANAVSNAACEDPPGVQNWSGQMQMFFYKGSNCTPDDHCTWDGWTYQTSVLSTLQA